MNESSPIRKMNRLSMAIAIESDPERLKTLRDELVAQETQPVQVSRLSAEPCGNFSAPKDQALEKAG